MQVKDFPLDHVGIAVRDLDEATQRYQQLASYHVLAEETVHAQRVKVRFLQEEKGSCKIELLQGTDPESPICTFLKKRGEGIHHLAFRVEDIQAEMSRLRREGFQILQDHPVKGALNKWIFFIHPKSMGGVLVEICQTAAIE